MNMVRLMQAAAHHLQLGCLHLRHHRFTAVAPPSQRSNSPVPWLSSLLPSTDAIDTQRYYRLRCSIPQPPKLYRLPILHKPEIPMRPMVSFCGSPTYQLSRYLTTILQPLTDKSRRELQSTENFNDAIKTVQIRKGLDKREMFGDQIPSNIVWLPNNLPFGHLVWCCFIVLDPV